MSSEPRRPARWPLWLGRVARLVPLRGRGRIAQELHRRVRAHIDGGVTVQMRRGSLLELPLTSSQSWTALFTGGYDDEVLTLLEEYVLPGSLVIDIGASLGLYTVPLARAAARTGTQVLAVEPMAGNVAVIERNLALNDLTGTVRVLHAALGTAPGTLEMHSESGGVGNAAATAGIALAEMASHDATGGQSHHEIVDMTTLDRVLAENDRPVSLIKMDVEGFEFDVLAGAQVTISHHRPALYTEMNLAWLASRGIPDTAFDNWITRYRYRCFEVILHHRDRWSDRRDLELRPIRSAKERSGHDLLLLPDK